MSKDPLLKLLRSRHPGINRKDEKYVLLKMILENYPVVDRTPKEALRYKKIVFATREEAEAVLDRLNEVLSDHESVEVARLLELIDAPGNYIAERWGWFDLSKARICRVNEGYLLDLPNSKLLD